MNIVLIGFMGSGKSTVGQRLADELSMDYLDADELIEKTEKMSVNDIFAKKGEPYFRKVETSIIKTIQEYDNFVISTGGGMVLLKENVKMLKEVGPLILLWADPESIYERIKNNTHRPLLNVENPLDAIKAILDKREPIYKKVADKIIDTSEIKIDEVVERIREYINAEN
jgi:shikimate kinase